MSESKTEMRLPRTVYVIFFSLVIDLLAFTLILPLFPSIFDYYNEHDKGGLYHFLAEKLNYFQNLFGVPQEFNKVLFGGFIGSLFSLLQFFSSAFLGAISDVYGRKPVLLLCMVGIALSYLLWAFSSSFFLFVLARIIGGVSKANISLSTAVIADVCPPQIRNKGMALVGIAFSIGFIIGPSIGAVFASFAKHHQGQFFVVPALFALFLALSDLLFTGLLFTETLPSTKRAKSISNGLWDSLHYLNPYSLFNFKHVNGLSIPALFHLRKIGVIYFLFLFLYSGLEFTLTFLTHLTLHYTRMQQAYTYLFSGIVMVIVQGGITRRVSQGKEAQVAQFGLFLIIPSFILLGLSKSSIILYMGLFLYAIASALVVPCLTSLASTFGSDDQKGKVLGVFRSLGALARALGPGFASLVFWCCGPGVCYGIGAILLIIPYSFMRSLSPSLKKSA